MTIYYQLIEAMDGDTDRREDFKLSSAYYEGVGIHTIYIIKSEKILVEMSYLKEKPIYI